MRQLISIGLLAALLATIPRQAGAERRAAHVETGSTRREVIALRGEPAERIERETKRTETWIYPGDEIVFSGDRVVEVREAPVAPEPAAEPTLPSVTIKGPSRHPSTASAPGKQVDIGALLAEVSKATPQEGEGGPNAPRSRPGAGN